MEFYKLNEYSEHPVQYKKQEAREQWRKRIATLAALKDGPSTEGKRVLPVLKN